MPKAYDDDYRSWFGRLLQELSVASADERVFGANTKRLHRGRFKPEAWARTGGGWHSGVAKTGSAQLEVWYDRYLDPKGDPHLGVWLFAGARTVKRVAKSVGASLTFTWDDRDDEGFLKSALGREQRRRIGNYVVDVWDREHIVGGYVLESPHMRDPAEAVGPVVGALRRLAAAANPTRPHIPEQLSDERHTELVERLARPNQLGSERPSSSHTALGA